LNAFLEFEFEIEGLKYLNFGDGVCKIKERNGCVIVSIF